MKQTAVEWLNRNLEILNLIKNGDLENELFRQIELEAKEIEKENMVVFLQSVFGMEGFDYEKSYDDFIYRRKNTKEEIDWSDMTDKDKEKLLAKNNNSELNKHFNKESKDVFDELDREIIKKYLK